MNRPALLHPLRLPALLSLPRRLSGAFSDAPLTAAAAVVSLLSAELRLAGCASPDELPPTHPLMDSQAQGATGTATP